MTFAATASTDRQPATHTLTRRIAVEGILGLALCAAGYFFLVDPVQSRIDRAREKMATMAASAAAPAPTVPAALAAEVLRDTTAKLAELERRSAASRDQGALFESLMSLAAQHTVHVDQMTPISRPKRAEARASAAAPPPPGAPAADPVEVTSVGYTLTLAGEFANVAAFIGAVQRDLGFSQLRAAQIEPVLASQGAPVRATIETQHFGIAAAPSTLQASAQETPR